MAAIISKLENLEEIKINPSLFSESSRFFLSELPLEDSLVQLTRGREREITEIQLDFEMQTRVLADIEMAFTSLHYNAIMKARKTAEQIAQNASTPKRDDENFKETYNIVYKNESLETYIQKITSEKNKNLRGKNTLLASDLTVHMPTKQELYDEATAKQRAKNDSALSWFKDYVAKQSFGGDLWREALNAADTVLSSKYQHIFSFIETLQGIKPEDQMEYLQLVRRAYKSRINPLKYYTCMLPSSRSASLIRMAKFEGNTSGFVDYSDSKKLGDRLKNSLIEDISENVLMYENDGNSVNSFLPFSAVSMVKGGAKKRNKQIKESSDDDIIPSDVEYALKEDDAITLTNLLNNRFRFESEGSLFSRISGLKESADYDVMMEWVRKLNGLYKSDDKTAAFINSDDGVNAYTYCRTIGFSLDDFVELARKSDGAIGSVPYFKPLLFLSDNESKRNLISTIIESSNGGLLGEYSTTSVLSDGVDTRTNIAISAVKAKKRRNPTLVIDSLLNVSALKRKIQKLDISERLLKTAYLLNPKAGGKNLTERAREAEILLDDYHALLSEFSGVVASKPIFDARLGETLSIYFSTLGKSFQQFERDLRKTGIGFEKISMLYDAYSKILPQERLVPLVNHVIKKTSRDLIHVLVELENSVQSREVLKAAAQKAKDANKEELVKLFADINLLYHYTREIDSGKGLSEAISASGKSFDEVSSRIKDYRRGLFTAVLGDIEVPSELEEMFGNAVIAYHRNTGKANGVDIQSALKLVLRQYAEGGAEAANIGLRRLSGNKNLRREHGAILERFLEGITMECKISTASNTLESMRGRIESELLQAYDVMKKLRVKESTIIRLREKPIERQMEFLSDFISRHRYKKSEEPFRQELNGHLKNARSVKGTLKQHSIDALFYVSQDPLESLHMGQFFNSCLSLGGNGNGANSWAAVVQTVDSNKNVIYARGKDGRYLSRNRAALTDNGILMTRFYFNYDFDMADAWVDYLQRYALHAGTDIMVPVKFLSSMYGQSDRIGRLLENLAEKGEAIRETRTCRISPGHYNAFFGDGIPTSKGIRGVEVKDIDVYVIRGKKEVS